jgi:hypothetical protein
VYTCGIYAFATKAINIPFGFYDQLTVPRECWKSYFHVAEDEEAGALYEECTRVSPEVAFVHSTSSNISVSIETPWDKDIVFTVNPNKNMYPPGHKWHELAETIINLPLLKYTVILKKARHVIVMDSAFFCLATLMQLEATTRICLVRGADVYDYLDSRFSFQRLSDGC